MRYLLFDIDSFSNLWNDLLEIKLAMNYHMDLLIDVELLQIASNRKITEFFSHKNDKNNHAMPELKTDTEALFSLPIESQIANN